MSAPLGNQNALGNNGGRPTDYDPEYARIAQEMCRLGATDADLARAFDVAGSTIALWKVKHVEFSESIRLGKEPADDRVEASLYHRAVGYSHDAVKIFMPAGADAPVYAPYIEHHAPDPTAGKFWLTNRRPKDWRDRHEVAHDLTDPLAELMKAIHAQSQPKLPGGG